MPPRKSPQSNQQKARSRYNVLARRRQVALLFDAGLNQQEIAARLQAEGYPASSPATVSIDMAAIKAALAQQAEEHLGSRRDREVAALDADEADLRAQVAAVLELAGDFPAVKFLAPLYKAIGEIQDRRARWLGFEKAPQGPGPLADLDALLRALDAPTNSPDDGAA